MHLNMPVFSCHMPTQSKNNPQVSKPSSFWIPRQAVKLLIDNNASATEIGTYLVIAKYSNKDNISGVTEKTISERLKISKEKVRAALVGLSQIGELNRKLLYSPEEVEKVFVPDLVTELQKDRHFRWLVNRFNEAPSDGVWFDKSLVGDYGDKSFPLEPFRRRQLADIALKILMVMHQYHDHFLDGVKADCACVPYGTTNTFGLGPFKLIQAVEDTLQFHSSLTSCVENCSTDIKTVLPAETLKRISERSHMLEKGFNELFDLGYIKRKIIVMQTDNSKPLYLYDLDKKSSEQIRKNGEVLLAGKVEKIAEHYGVATSIGGKRFYKTYSAIVPIDMEAEITGVFKLKFSPRSGGYSAGQQFRDTQRKTALNWISKAYESRDQTLCLALGKQHVAQDEILF